jgi:DNA-binding NtrC family response regulator
MNDFDMVVEQRIKEFVDELQALVRRAALAAVEDALGGEKTETSKPGPRKAPKQRVAAAAAAKKAPAKLGGRRSPAQLSRTVAELKSQIAANPGQSIEQIASALGTKTRVLALPVKKLIAAGDIRKEGVKRNTRYFPASGGAQPAPEPKRAKRRNAKK